MSSFDATTATGFSAMMNGDISHDAITRMLSSPSLTPKDLWLRVKPQVLEIESDEGVLMIDDSILEKPSTDESALFCSHVDHSKGRSVKGINFITALYHNQDVSLPVGVHQVLKSKYQTAPKTGKLKHKALFTKHPYCSLLTPVCQTNLHKRRRLNDCPLSRQQ